MSSLSKLLSVLDLFGPQTLKIDPDTATSRICVTPAC
jgi:hypothetical protein